MTTLRQAIHRLPALLSVIGILNAPSAAAQQSSAAREVARYEDYLSAAGTLDDGVLHVRLEARPTQWRPWGDDGLTLDVHAFAVEGAATKIPGPLLRVTAGTTVHVTVRNTLDDTLVVRGFRDRVRHARTGQTVAPTVAAFTGDSLVVAPNAPLSRW